MRRIFVCAWSARGSGIAAPKSAKNWRRFSLDSVMDVVPHRGDGSFDRLVVSFEPLERVQRHG